MSDDLKPGEIIVSADVKRIWMEVVVTRADGTVEDYGTVAMSSKNKIEQTAFDFVMWLKKKGIIKQWK